MSEAISGAPELQPQAERVGNHLLRQIEIYNPLLSDPIDQFEAAVIVAEYGGSPQAFDLAWSALRSSPEHFKSVSYDDFAETLIERHGSQGAIEAKELVPFIPDSDETLTRPMVLTMVAEATDDEDLRQEATAEAVKILKNLGPDVHSIMTHPSDLLVRLGAANQREDLLELALETLPGTSHKFDFMEAIAKALKNTGDAQNMRSSLVQAAIKAQREGIAFPATIVRYGFKELLNDAEMKELLRAVHRDGKQQLHKGIDTVFNRHQDGISVSNGTEFTAFNELASEYDTWSGPIEHARFAVKALRTRLGEAWRHEGRSRGSYSSAAYMARKISQGLAANPSLTADDILEHGYMFHDDIPESEARLHGLWSFGVMPLVKNGRLRGAEARDVDTIHELRNSLPYLSASRIELNGALAKSGDRFALVDSARALTHDSEGILTRPIRKEDKTIERHPYLFPYKWSFFELVQPQG